MHRKKLTALLLLLALVFTLPACAPSGEMSAKDVRDAEAGSAPSCEALIAAVEQVYNKPDATLADMMTVCYGADFSAAMQDFLDVAKEMDDAEPELLSDIDLLNLPDYAEGSEVKLAIAGTTALSAEELQALQDKLDASVESMQLIESLATMYDSMTEEDLSENGMTPDDVSQMKLYMEKLVQVGSVFAGCAIEQAGTLKLNVTVDGKTSEIEKTAVMVNGCWMLSDFIDLMD